MHTILLPRLGQTMERGLIERWLKAEGDSFVIGDVLYEVETEKATVEVEAKRDGTIARIIVSEGEEVEIHTLIAVAAEPGETFTEEQIAAAIADSASHLREGADEAPAEAQAPQPSGSDAAGSRVKAVPLARAMAQKHGIDLSAITGSGPNETITADDVKAAIGRSGGGSGDSGPAVRERRPVRGIARTMADVVTRSWREVPQFVQQITVDASGLAQRKERFAAEVRGAAGVELSFSDLLLDAIVRAAAEVPEANSSFAGDEVVLYEDVNISVAVTTDAGLIVPVLRKAQSLSLAGLASELRALAERARAGALTPPDVSGGTITFSNLGMFGVETGVPLVTVPQAVIVFAGAIVERPASVKGQLKMIPQLGLAIGFDHRVLDGVTAAQFTAALRQAVEGT